MTETVTRAYLADIFYSRVGIPFTESLVLVDTILDGISDSLKNEGHVKIPRFGSFTVRKKQPRQGRNPKTGQEALISARNVVSFYPSKTLKNQINT
ncbi:MAG: integration host factor subunit alpha [Alphaproteobacteria bacterium]|nr:integration host factor subunit alpha [Alphaproteobacteria bacterium]